MKGSLWQNLKQIGGNIARGARDTWGKVKTIGKPLLNTAGKIINGAKTITNYIDKSPLGNIIKMSPYGGIYEMGKKGLNIADQLRQSGERILDGGNVIRTVKDALPKIGVTGDVKTAVDNASNLQDAIRNRDMGGGLHAVEDFGKQAKPGFAIPGLKPRRNRVLFQK